MALRYAPYDGIIRIRFEGQGNVYPNLSRFLRQHPFGVFFVIIVQLINENVKMILLIH